MRIFLLTLLAIFLATIVYLASVIIPVAGVFQTLEPKLVDQCTRLDIHPGTEDVAIDPQSGIVFVSADNRRDWFTADSSKKTRQPGTGGIFIFDSKNPAQVTRVSPPEIEDFSPHGISLWAGANNQRRLFVINHPSTGEQLVEIFDVGPDHHLTHLESISFSAMTSPNDVVAVGPRSFYATNDRGFLSGILSTIELYFALPAASAVYFDGQTGRKIASGLTFANGINTSANGETLYIAEFLKRRIAVFNRDIDTGTLKLVKRIRVNTGPDNIDVDKDGNLWIGGHSKAFEFQAHAEDANNNAPSHVIKVDATTNEVNDVFISTNGEINGSSVGAVHNGTLIVGAVFDPHVMICPLPGTL